MKHFFYFFFLFSGSLFAQEAHILFNRLNMSVFNPAFTGTNGAFISLNSRSQWTGVSEAPRTNYLVYNLPKKERVRLGFSAQNDRVFIENKTRLNIDYNYEIQLNQEQFLYLGLKGGGFYNSIDTNQLQRIYTSYNPALASVESYFTPILGVGIQLKTPIYFLGIGVPSLFKNKRFQDNAGWETTATDHAYLYFSGGMNVAINQILSLDPVIVYRAVPNSPNLFMGTIALNYKEIFSFGGGYSTNNNLAFFIRSKSVQGIDFGYGYEFMNRGDSTAIQGGTHEFVVRFKFAEKEEEEESPRKDGYD
ncbi:PorP/SprF family type IX secretion system membrane protein [Flavobacteriaceae bacterium]|nr:PorP/SprF family type IX secretion system membrane protein [Flavobacteriaceae bacterium]